MNLALKSLVTFVAGTALGLLMTWAIVGRGMGGDVRDGPWRTSLLTGSAQSGLYLRASVALHGLLALNRNETIYYTAVTDSAGDTLRGDCSYTVAGRDPPSRWWSVTAYGPDDYLIPGSNRYSVTKNSVAHDRTGGFSASVSQKPQVADGIAVAPGPFSLTLRLYNPDPKVAADPAHVVLPVIRRERCP
jgi:hypothetical protein